MSGGQDAAADEHSSNSWSTHAANGDNHFVKEMEGMVESLPGPSADAPGVAGAEDRRLDRQALARLMQMGFDAEASQRALLEAGNNVEAAIGLITGAHCR